MLILVRQAMKQVRVLVLAFTACGGVAHGKVFLETGFEGSTTLPTGWTQSPISGSATWTIQKSSSAAHGGSNYAKLYAGNSNDNKTQLISPIFDTETYTNISLTFWHTQKVWGADQDELKVFYSSDGGSTWTQLAHYTENVSAWTQRTVNIPTASANSRVAFEGNAKWGYGVFLDDIQVSGAPTLWPEVSVSATDATASEAGQDPGTWTITRIGDTTGPSSVNYTLSGTAVAGSDYNVDTPSPINFAAGETSVTVTLTPVDDTVSGEELEVATLTLAESAEYVIGDAAGDISIIDDDDYDLNILVIGSTRDSGNSGYVSGSSDPFQPAAIGTELDNILSGAGLGSVNVSVLDRSAEGYSTRVYSLAQWFHYPYPSGVETTTRWPNLRGESGVLGTDWDYVILIGDPYTMEYMPGLYAQGVNAVAEEVAKGGAETVLLMPWPAAASGSSVAHYKEVVYRAGRTGGYKVAPAGLAWEADGSDPAVTPLSARGAYICAASIFSRVWGQSASNSTYTYDDTLADSVNTTVTTNIGAEQYSGKFSFQNPFLLLGDTRRNIHFSEKGSSTERDFRSAVQGAMGRCRVSSEVMTYQDKYLDNTPEDDGLGWPTGNPMPLAWNHGRNSSSEPDKNYEVNTNHWQLGFGFKYQYEGLTTWGWPVADSNDDYIERIFSKDLDLADYMISQDNSARCIPIRLLWAQIQKEYPTLYYLSDGAGPHLNGYLISAVGTYMYTLYSGRCPLNTAPSSMNQSWFAQKVGYETAWRMGTGSSRAPGFKVMPSSATALTVTPTTTEAMTVQFIFQPRSNVTVTVSSSDTSAGIAGPQTLVFTPSNYDVPQQVTVTGVPGSSASAPFNVVYTTTSDDPAYDGLSDSWAYTTVRSALNVTRTDHGTIQYDTPKNVGVRINLNASEADAGNTVFTGPNNGTLSWDGPDVIYTPTTNYVGPDGFAYSSLVSSALTVGYISIDVLESYPAGAVRAEATDSTASEQGLATGTLTIIREGDTTSSLAVNFALSGSATFGDDYTLSASSPVTIPAGANSITVTLTPVDDAVVGERTETASLTITAGAGYTAVSNPATVSITDNDNTLPVVNAGTNQTVKLLSVDTSPGLWYGTAPGNVDTSATIPNPKSELLLDVASRTEQTIASNTTAIYTGQIYDEDGIISFTENITKGYARIWIDGVLVINDNQDWRRAVTGNLNLTPGWHDIEIRLSGQGPGGIGYDPNGTAMWLPLVDPGDESLLRVLDAPLRGERVVNLVGTVTDAEDTPGMTWSLISGPEGAAVRFGSVYAVNTTATVFEPGTYVFRLTANDGYGAVYNEVTITVLDFTKVSVSATDADASETGPDTGTFTINRSGYIGDTMDVNFVMSGTATFGDDYSLSTSSPITFLAGQTSAVVTLTPVDDAVFGERNETASLTITAGVGYGVSSNLATVSITDNDNNLPVVNAGNNQNLQLTEHGPVVEGLTYGPWTGDEDSGISSGKIYTVAHNFGNNHAAGVTVNGVAFTESFDTSGAGWFIGGNKSDWNGDDNALVTGSSEDLAEEFILNGNPRTVTFTGLVVGQSYEAVFYSVAFETGNRVQTFTATGGSSGVINQDAYDNNNGIAIRFIYTATSASQAFTISPTASASFHLYAMTNAEVYESSAITDLNGSASDDDADDPLTITWSKVSGDGQVSFSDATALNSKAVFSEAGTYVLRLTVDDGYGPVYDEVTIIVNAPLPASYAAWSVGGGFSNPFTDIGLDSNPDGDNANNLMEFAFGTDPTLSNEGAMVIDGSANGQPVIISNGSVMELFFVRRDDHGTSGSVSYTVQFSSDLATFYDNAVTPTVVANSSVNSNYEVVKVAYPASLPNGQAGKFGRIKIEFVP